MNKFKPGELWAKHQGNKKKHEKRRKAMSESDAGSMKGYDPNLGLGQKGYAKATATPKAAGMTPRQITAQGTRVGNLDPRAGMGNANSTKMMAKKKHSKHKKNWIQGAIKHPGALHRELGVKSGNKIPAKTLAKAAKKGGKEGKRARLAETLKGFHHKKHEKHEKKEHKHEKHHKMGKHCKTCSCE